MRQTALVTGATSDIGEQYAIELAKEGYDLIITGQKVNAITKVAQEIIRNYKVKVEVCIIDFADDERRHRFMEHISTKKITVLVNNAEKEFFRDDYKKQEDMIKVHVLTTTELMHTVIPHMIHAREGEIINVSSLAAFLVLPSSIMYGATKSYLTSFSMSLGTKLKSDNIKVQALCPGFVSNTDYHNMQQHFWMSAQEIVRISRKYIIKDTTLCIPGKINRIFYHLLPVIPNRLYLSQLKRKELKKCGII
ncbi:MAG: hypothetical protein ATN34_04955 [Epulopiscium sp. Nele67-Bin002]|nr:MAG: hypothetical protein ATN34_04955 [Epulopiscium sp. Nele67-Bin002]OON94181.1 MAG: hypothetical protein ATN33_04765 [Epulopiscium sp. Nele67-Bin001]